MLKKYTPYILILMLISFIVCLRLNQHNVIGWNESCDYWLSFLSRFVTDPSPLTFNLFLRQSVTKLRCFVSLKTTTFCVLIQCSYYKENSLDWRSSHHVAIYISLYWPSIENINSSHVTYFILWRCVISVWERTKYY